MSKLTFSGLKNEEIFTIYADYHVGKPIYDSADVGTGKTVTGTKEDYIFVNGTSDNGTGVFEKASNPETIFSMPNCDVELTEN